MCFLYHTRCAILTSKIMKGSFFKSKAFHRSAVSSPTRKKTAGGKNLLSELVKMWYWPKWKRTRSSSTSRKKALRYSSAVKMNFLDCWTPLTSRNSKTSTRNSSTPTSTASRMSLSRKNSNSTEASNSRCCAMLICWSNVLRSRRLSTKPSQRSTGWSTWTLSLLSAGFQTRALTKQRESSLSRIWYTVLGDSTQDWYVCQYSGEGTNAGDYWEIGAREVILEQGQ